MKKVKLVPTNWDVFVDGDRIGSIIDCGDCFRVWLRDRRMRRVVNADYDTWDDAVRAVVGTVTGK